MAKHVLTSGQSLAVGSQGTPSLSTASETANTFLLAADGTIATPLKNATTQYPQLSMGYRIGASRPAETFAFSTHGLSGKTIAELSKGGSTGMYEQAIAYVTASARQVEALHWIQGEADQTFATPQATYLTSLATLHANYTADIAAITAQSSLPLITSQTATWAHYGTPASIGLAQLKAAREQAGVYLVGGQYQLEYYTDGLHMTNVGYYHLGELHARAHEAVISGAGWAPFAPVGTNLTPGYLDVAFHVPTGALEFNTTRVPAQPNMGFSLHGTTATITGVSLVASDAVRLTLSKAVTEPGAAVGYGVAYDNGSVGLGNLTDGETTTSVYDGARLANWAVHFKDDLGIAASGETTAFRASSQALVFRADGGFSPLDVKSIVQG